MNNFEKGYPSTSIIDFFANGWWKNPECFHYTLGLVLLIAFSLRVILTKQQSLSTKFIILYFSTFIFNNPAYRLFGLQFNEYMGFLGCLFLFFQVFKTPVLLKRDYRESIVGYSILAVTLVFAFHAVFVNMIGALPLSYSDLKPEVNITWLRIMLIGKVVILGLMIISADLNFRDEKSWKRLIHTVIIFGLAAAAVYITQMIMYYGVGIFPYGCWWDAGGSSFRSFGGVSMERGHFSKFFVPFFPFFLWGLMKEKRFISFIIYLIISSINFSSSGQAFLFIYIVFSFLIFRKSITKHQICFGFVIIILLGITFHDAYIGVLRKIWEIGILGGQKVDAISVSGRSPQVLLAFLKSYPWGISYGGSTLRGLNNFPANNMGIFVFLSQLSFLALPIIIGFFALIRYVIKKAKSCSDHLSYKVFLIGSIVPVFIYCIDVLWFIPHIWLPLVILNHLGNQTGENIEKGRVI